MRSTVVVALLTAALASGTAQAQSSSSGNASSTGFCDRSHQTSATEQDHLLRFAAAVRDALNVSGTDTAIISRSGLDLSRFHIRYSHAAVVTKNEVGTWTARQLYYACDEGHPRLFDQGLAGFVGGTDDPSTGYISLVIVPPAASAALNQASKDNARALGLLATTYSANAYPFSTLYQNCNQWVIELLAIAWGNLTGAHDNRSDAQQWLKAEHYDPAPVNVDSGILMIASAFSPMLHLNDHPEADRQAMRLQVSLPSTIEQFIHARLPDTARIELCHNERQIVVHHGWQPVGDGCQAGDGDTVISLN